MLILLVQGIYTFVKHENPEIVKKITNFKKCLRKSMENLEVSPQMFKGTFHVSGR